MEIKEEKVTQTIKTYTFTEDEYHELIYNQRKYGYNKALEYIGFCVGNYKYKVSTLGGIAQFIEDLLDYVKVMKPAKCGIYIHKGKKVIIK